MRDHNQLRAFELADERAIMIYKITRSFPKDEIYGLTSQMRRAGVSVASNIDEGCARKSQNDYCRFLEMAYGSLRELQYQFGLSVRLGYIGDQEAQEGNFKTGGIGKGTCSADQESAKFLNSKGSSNLIV